MKKTTFKISKMDCPSEEQMIRMKLEGIDSIEQLSFDIPQRKLTIFHTAEVDRFEQRIYDLKLEASLMETVDEEMEVPAKNQAESNQKTALWWVLIINFVFFILEMTYGWLSKSMGLVADSLDMLADSIVYGLSLMAVGAAIAKKKLVAKLSGYFQIALALFGLIEVIRRFVGFEAIPVFQTMIIISFLALIANSISLYLIQRTKSKEAHIQASMIFTSNDIVINLGVITAGILVHFTSSRYPDLVIGSIIFLIVIKGAIRILNLAK
ncbi:cation transporter [Flexithrix dorotheae]|uniref:cation transporter n=1 Tax=Flexithrix dorotheae TaxID=70993 RepID=UPI0004767304|nr:cation transporter [Flexithrix dorotheae]